MLLAIDIGNSNIALGIFNGRDLIRNWRIKSDRERTGDEYAILILDLIRAEGIEKTRIEGVVISSVVPPLTPVFQELSRSLFDRRPVIVGPGLKTGMPILYENPHEVGADRIAAAAAAYEKFSGPVIVCDFGTATTFDAVTRNGEYMGGAIAPGVQIAAEALYLKTAKLPHVEIKKPKRIIGRTTENSIQAGLFHGYVGLVSHIIDVMKGELEGEAQVVCTGGFAGTVFQDIGGIDHHEPDLVLDGLRILYERNV